MDDLRDRVQGLLIGLVAGDRNGGPMNMAVRLAESLLTWRGFDADDVGKHYFEWWKREGFDTGPTADHVFQLVESGQSFEDAAQHVHAVSGGMTAGCNPAHRAAPLAMSPEIQDEQLPEAAGHEARLTHWHELAGDASAAVVVLCRTLARGSTWEDAQEITRVGRLDETRSAFGDVSREPLNAGGYAPDVLAAALHFVSQATSFEQALEASLRFAGPANYCPVIVGSIAGARWGASAIGEHQLAHCRFLGRVRDVCQKLANRW